MSTLRESTDHQVQYHVDVQRARGEDAEAMHLEEHGVVEQAADGAHGRIESLQVADLHRAAQVAGQADDLVGLGEAGGDGFFDQKIDAGGQQRARTSCVMHRGHAERSRIRFAGRETLVD
jgi:hypothetical protein